MSVRKREEAYSVRLPSGFTHVGSSAARRMLAVLFAQRVPLADDPGSGDEYIKLTLPRAQVHALQALAGGDPAGVALRRLVATFGGSSSLPARQPVRALMAPMPPVAARSRAVLEAGIIRSETSRLRPLPRPRVPEAEALRSSLKNRLDWTPEYRAMIVARIRELEGTADPELPRPIPTSHRSIARRSPALMDDPVFRILFLLAAVLVILAIHFGGWPALAFGGPEARPASPYPEWRPK